MRMLNLSTCNLISSFVLSMLVLILLATFGFSLHDYNLQPNVALVVEPKEIDLGVVKIGSTKSFSFVLANFSNRDIKVLGKSIPCDCTQIDMFPNKISSNKKSEFKLIFKPLENQVGQSYSSTIKVFVDEVANPIVEMRFTSRVER